MIKFLTVLNHLLKVTLALLWFALAFLIIVALSRCAGAPTLSTDVTTLQGQLLTCEQDLQYAEEDLEECMEKVNQCLPITASKRKGPKTCACEPYALPDDE